ncbi:MAG: hypothetical protein J5980_05665 [Muribaculaceae bacterium]|nr:hypothetical protein [Muribaculaceae bacterium]
MTTETNNNVTVTVPDTQWRGLTLDELRKRRAKALLRREVGKVKINAALGNVRTRVNDNGIRGLMFSNKAISNLKAADYVFLGWKIARLFIKARRRK